MQTWPPALRNVTDYQKLKEVVLAFGSRILKLDNQIKRKWYRFLLGRFVATAISNTLKLIYTILNAVVKFLNFKQLKKYR